jgi:CDP-diglyceride synthetase
MAGLSLTGLIFAVLASMLLAYAVGYLFRRLPVLRGRPSESNSQESYLVGSIIGVLALLLAFSFGMAVDRYEERRHLVVQEANAIGTSYLRTQLLDEPYRTRLGRLLVDYTDNRIALASAAGSERDRRLTVNDRLLVGIWSAAADARQSAASRGVSVPFYNSVNEVIDLDLERKIARQARVPGPILLLLLGFLVIVAAVLGHVVEERRARVGALVFFLLLSLYVGVIADFSRPATGSIRESQDPMRLLQASFESLPLTPIDRPQAASGRGQ